MRIRFILLFGVIALLSVAFPAFAASFYVNCSGSSPNYASVPDAVAAVGTTAHNGPHEIVICPGTYLLSATQNLDWRFQGLTIRSSTGNRDEVVLRAKLPLFQTQTSGITFSGVTLVSTDNEAVKISSWSEKITFQNVALFGTKAISIAAAGPVIVEDSELNATGNGIEVTSQVGGLTVTRSRITAQATAISIAKVYGWFRLTDLFLTANSGIWIGNGSGLTAEMKNVTITANVRGIALNNMSLALTADSEGRNSVVAEKEEAILLGSNAGPFVIRDTYLKGKSGLRINNRDAFGSWEVERVEIAAREYGIYLRGGSGSPRIRDVSITATWNALNLEQVYDLVIDTSSELKRNTFEANSHAILFRNGGNLTVKYSKVISRNGIGINFSNGWSEYDFQYNDIESAKQALYIADGADKGLIKDNFLRTSGSEYALELGKDDKWGTAEIKNNCFDAQNNAINRYHKSSFDRNYWGAWSDQCEDANSDGVCDTPYQTNGIAKEDQHPLKYCPIASPQRITLTVEETVVVREGNDGTRTVNIPIKASTPLPDAVTLSWRWGTGTATGESSCSAGIDYLIPANVVTLPKGAADAEIALTVCGDSTPEPDETVVFEDFTATMNGTPVTIAPTATTLTILNDDLDCNKMSELLRYGVLGNKSFTSGNNSKINGYNIRGDVLNPTTPTPTGELQEVHLDFPPFSPSLFPASQSSTDYTNPSTVPPGDYRNIIANGTVFTGEGTYRIKTLQTNSNGTVTFYPGDYFIENFILANNSEVTIAGDGEVNLYIKGWISAAQQVVFNSDGKVENLKIYLYNGAQFVAGNYSNGSHRLSFNGMIYSPYPTSKVQLGNNGKIRGAILVAGTIGVGNNTEFFYDQEVEAALKGSLGCAVTRSALHHLQIDHNAQGLTCEPLSITLKACADENCTSHYDKGVTVALTASDSAVAIAPNPVTFTGTTTVQVAKSTAGTITLGVTSLSPEATASPAYRCSSDSCSIDFTDFGVQFTDEQGNPVVPIPTQLSAKPFSQTAGSDPNRNEPTRYALKAVRKDTNTGACVAAVSGSRDVTLEVACVDPDQCAVAQPLAIDASPVSNPVTRPLTFDAATGIAPLGELSYHDAGKIKLTAQLSVPLPAPLSGEKTLTAETNAFVVKPAGFCVEASGVDPCTLANPAACAASAKAGEGPVTLTVRAVAWQQVQDDDLCAGNGATPNFRAAADCGSADTIQLSTKWAGGGSGYSDALFVNASGEVAHACPDPSGNFTAAVGNVGVFRFAARLEDYLGTGELYSESVPYGRFYAPRIRLRLVENGGDARAQLTGNWGVNSRFLYLGQNNATDTDEGTLAIGDFTLEAGYARAAYGGQAASDADLDTTFQRATNYQGDYAKVPVARLPQDLPVVLASDDASAGWSKSNPAESEPVLQPAAVQPTLTAQWQAGVLELQGTALRRYLSRPATPVAQGVPFRLRIDAKGFRNATALNPDQSELVPGPDLANGTEFKSNPSLLRGKPDDAVVDNAGRLKPYTLRYGRIFLGDGSGSVTAISAPLEIQYWRNGTWLPNSEHQGTGAFDPKAIDFLRQLLRAPDEVAFSRIEISGGNGRWALAAVPADTSRSFSVQVCLPLVGGSQCTADESLNEGTQSQPLYLRTCHGSGGVPTDLAPSACTDQKYDDDPRARWSFAPSRGDERLIDRRERF